MAKTESSFRNMFLTLLVITAVASLALGGIYTLTKEPIAAARKARFENAIKMVMPEFDSIISYKVLPEDGIDSMIVIKGYIQDSIMVGTAISTYSNKGYNPEQIQIMIGFLPDGSIYNTTVTQQKETPGLGTKMSDAKFKDQFNTKNLQDFKLKVKKDGGDVDAITAATISSRAFCDAVQRAYDVYQKEGGNK
jgi:Na+-translocating ferredoxin:NAD+ oxidoreductase subunit G